MPKVMAQAARENSKDERLRIGCISRKVTRSVPHDIDHTTDRAKAGNDALSSVDKSPIVDRIQARFRLIQNAELSLEHLKHNTALGDDQT
jgi:hypothetical protein